MKNISQIKKIAILTSGGDAPGMNATLHAACLYANSYGYELFGVQNSYKGLINKEFSLLDIQATKTAFKDAGSILGSVRSLEFKDSQKNQELAVQNLLSENIEHLIVVGGNGSFQGVEKLAKLGLKIWAIPGTIDNDVQCSNYTIGFHSAMQSIFESIEKIRATSNSSRQVIFVEAMGRYCYDLTVYAGIAAQVDLIITSENIMTVAELLQFVQHNKFSNPNKGIVILVTELVYGEKFGFGLPSLTEVALQIQTAICSPVRVNVLGYIQRGAKPTALEIFQAFGYIDYTFQLIQKNCFNQAICFNGHDYFHLPIDIANQFIKPTKTHFINNHNKLLNFK